MNNILHEAKEEREQPNGIAQEREREKPGRRPGPSRCCLCVIVFILFLRILFFCLFVCFAHKHARAAKRERDWVCRPGRPRHHARHTCCPLCGAPPPRASPAPPHRPSRRSPACCVCISRSIIPLTFRKLFRRSRRMRKHLSRLHTCLFLFLLFPVCFARGRETCFCFACACAYPVT